MGLRLSSCAQVSIVPIPLPPIVCVSIYMNKNFIVFLKARLESGSNISLFVLIFLGKKECKNLDIMLVILTYRLVLFIVCKNSSVFRQGEAVFIYLWKKKILFYKCIMIWYLEYHIERNVSNSMQLKWWQSYYSTNNSVSSEWYTLWVNLLTLLYLNDAFTL